MKILLPVDGSAYTRHMLDYVGTHDALFGASHDYRVLTVVPPIPSRAANFLSRDTIDDYYRDEAEKVLPAVRAFLEGKGWRFQAGYVVGHPAQAIAAHAVEQGSDIIVMGSHGHSMLGNVVLGSVASGVLARTRVPVLLIR